jgi:hypothetical protein
MSEVTKEEVGAALEELMSNKETYAELVKAVTAKGNRNVPLIIKELSEAIAEGRKDYAAAAPVVVGVADALRKGTTTSEFKLASFLTKVLTCVTILAPVIEGVLAVVRHTEFGNSMYVVGISIFLQTFVTQRYAATRTSLKEQAMEAEVISSENIVALAKAVSSAKSSK